MLLAVRLPYVRSLKSLLVSLLLLSAASSTSSTSSTSSSQRNRTAFQMAATSRAGALLFRGGCRAFGAGASRALMIARLQAATISDQAAARPRSLSPCARVIPVPILSDNYAYIIVDPMTGKAACVDPAEPSKILAAAKKEGVDLTLLLCTHKHADHSGGNMEMKSKLPGLEVVTTKYEEIPGSTKLVGDGDVYQFGSLDIRALYTPCHTKGHILFFVTPSKGQQGEQTAPLLFSGDTLFVGGCGRFFEGNGAEMVQALMGRAAQLPPETLVYCGHEYTKSNLAFAKFVEPGNQALLEKIAWVDRTLASGGYTVPTTIGEELATNPFMRVNVPEVIQSATGGGSVNADAVQVMSALREMKNNFRG